MNVHILEDALPQQFYACATTEVAPNLLGAFLCRRLNNGQIIAGRIVETEAYRDNEPACHAFRGPTPRCEIMFGPAGFAYVYFIYGTNHCLNVVTEEPGRGCAVLIRAIDGSGYDTAGPGKICKHFLITRQHNGLSLFDRNGEIWIAPGKPINTSEIGISPRIGISAAADLPWRYFIKNNRHVSGPRALNCGDHIILPATVRRARRLSQI